MKILSDFSSSFRQLCGRFVHTEHLQRTNAVNDFGMTSVSKSAASEKDLRFAISECYRKQSSGSSGRDSSR